MSAANLPNAIPNRLRLVPNAINAIPPATRAAAIFATITIICLFRLIHSLTLIMTSFNRSVNFFNSPANAEPTQNAVILTTRHNAFIASFSTAAAVASSVRMMIPIARASSTNLLMPAAPSFIIGSSDVPLRPKIIIAAAACRVGSLMLLIRSAISVNCSSGVKSLSCRNDNPNIAKASVAVLSPRSASNIVRCIRRTPTSKDLISVPDCSAANDRPDKLSTDIPVRFDILSNESPIEVNILDAAAKGANITAPNVTI